MSAWPQAAALEVETQADAMRATIARLQRDLDMARKVGEHNFHQRNEARDQVRRLQTAVQLHEKALQAADRLSFVAHTWEDIELRALADGYDALAVEATRATP